MEAPSDTDTASWSRGKQRGAAQQRQLAAGAQRSSVNWQQGCSAAALAAGVQRSSTGSRGAAQQHQSVAAKAVDQCGEVKWP
jgi:hypothetical protein